MDLDKLLQVGTEGHVAEIKKKRMPHPRGWEPGLELRGNGGEVVVSRPTNEAPEDWDAILDELLPKNIDRTKYAIDPSFPVEVRAWDGNVGEGEIVRLYYFKAKIQLRTTPDEIKNLDDIVKAARKAKKPRLQHDSTEERAYFLQITDLQAGQADGGGVEAMVAKALELADLAAQDIKNLKKSGKPVDRIFIPITGDLVEGISGWYEMQTFSVSLDRRDQVKLVRRLLTEVLLGIAAIGLPVHVAVVPGNHGENRQNGKAFTTLADNDDVAVVEQIAEAFALAEVENVTFSFPARERISMTVEVLGWVAGLTHGHIARASGTPEAKILSWFKSMAAVRDPIGDADILFTGHYHSGKWSQLIGDTEWIQGGALCDSSAWFSQSAGLVSDPLVMKGTITREQKLELLMPYRWPRTRVETKELA
jgi:hypothetical protein